MYICNCNGVRARQVEAAIEAGAASPRAVLRAFGHEPCCGRCLPEIVERLRARDHRSDAGDARRSA